MTDGRRVISAAALRERLEDPSVSILEVSAATDDHGYRRGHIPGAQWAHWKTLLWDERMRAFRTRGRRRAVSTSWGSAVRARSFSTATRFNTAPTRCGR